MKKMILLLMLISVMAVTCCGCGASSSVVTESTAYDDADQTDPDDDDPYTIKWGLIGIWTGQADLSMSQEAVNELLAQMGSEYRIEIEAVSLSAPEDDETDEEYAISYVDAALSGGYDIITTVNSYNSYSIARMLADEGAAEPISEWLQTTDTGNALYAAYPESFWESLSYNGDIYGIANISTSLKCYAVFNADIADEYGIDLSDITIDDIAGILGSAAASGMGDDGVVIYSSPLSFMYNDGNYLKQIGEAVIIKETEDGLKAELFLDDDMILDWMSSLNMMGQAGLIYYDTLSAELIGGGHFFMIDTYSYSAEGALLDVAEAYGEYGLDASSLYAVSLPELDVANVNAASITCVMSESEKKEAALEMLGMIYSDPSLTNALVYGSEGESYTIDDNGHVAAAEDTDFKYIKMYLGNTFLLMPEDSETDEKAQDLWDILEDSSSVIGIYGIDTGEYTDVLAKINRLILEEYSDVLYGDTDDIEGALADIREELDQLGVYEVIEYINEQLGAY